jgi:hypothetical protein
MVRTVRRAVVLAVGGLVAVLILASCGGSSGSKVLPPEPHERATVYVALGGTDNVTDDSSSLASVWSQRLFRSAFRRSAVFLDLAETGAGATQILRSQVDDAVRLHPDVVSVTLVDDADRGADPTTVGRDLRAALDRLHGASPATVLVGTIPRGVANPRVTDSLDRAITTAADGRARLVDLSPVDVRDDGADRQIAQRFAAALRPR